MVQGKTKGLQQKASSSRHAHKAAANTKKGKRAVAPKKAVLVKQATMHKNLSAKINKSIEQQMVNAASSGKLTIMKNTAPDAEGSKAKKSKPDARARFYGHRMHAAGGGACICTPFMYGRMGAEPPRTAVK